MDDADGGMALETKLNLKYGKTTKRKSGTKSSKNGKAKTKNPPRFINTIPQGTARSVPVVVLPNTILMPLSG
jgi:hypothetical protein